MKFYKSLYFTNILFISLTGLIVVFIAGFVWPILFAIAKISLLTLFVATIADLVLLFRKDKNIFARRVLPEKLSNGDENDIKVFIENYYRFPIKVNVIDEIPFQFQVRDFNYKATIPIHGNYVIDYKLRPVKRGGYSFGGLNIYVLSPIRIVSRRFVFDQSATVPVYPSFMQMNKYELLAISNNLTEGGIKRQRKLGHSTEFENIREYVLGDDPRTINWRATARKSDLMVNHYMDEKSQQVYCVIDKGRTMQMPFNGLSLLDYAINASLVLSNIALKKEDKAGIITFSDKIGTILKAQKRRSQMHVILDTLYNQRTKYQESDFEMLYAQIRHNLHQRALLVLFSNFGSVSALYRQMPYLRKIASNHLLVVVFFEDTELDKILESSPNNTEQIFIKTIAEQFMFEKKQMVKELEAVGIHAILTPPDGLTVNVINKYLELKSRRLI
ncbi:MAG TPA: DUF58 domain-containing protein [Bacteroidia bacterium]|nr:DUF58 domain-containing protein [Bacteroidia bacterium]